MRSVLLLVFFAGLALCSPRERGSFQNQEPLDEDAEVISNREPVVIVDPPYRYDAMDSGDMDEDDDDFFNFRFPGFRPRPAFRVDWFDMMQRRIAMMNAIIAGLINKNRPMYPMFPGSFDFDEFDNLPPTYDNTTFTTKTVNGSVISVNETIKKHVSNDSSFIFHIKTVQVRPLNETEGVDVESVGTSAPAVEGARVTPEPRPEMTTTDDEISNDVNVARRFKRLASQLDSLERNLNDLSKNIK